MVVANGTEGEPASAKDRVLHGPVAASRPGRRGARGGAHRRQAGGDRGAPRRPGDHRPGRGRARSGLAWTGCGWRSARRRTGSWPARPARSCTGSSAASPRPPRRRRGSPQRGLGGAPTLVQNVETLAHLALIARYGAAWFRSAGHAGRARLDAGHRARRGVRAGRARGRRSARRSGQLLELAGGASAPPQALLLGGYFGTWVDAAGASARPFSSAGLADLGAGPGRRPDRGPARRCLRARPRPPGWCATWPASPPASAARAVFGLPAIAGQVERLADGRRADPRLLRRWLGQVDGRGGCAHPDGAVAAGAQRAADVRRRAGTARRAAGAADRRVLPVPPGGRR